MTEDPVRPPAADEVISYLRGYLDQQGLGPLPMTPETELVALGLDSIHLAEVLLLARAELAEAGRIPTDATLTTLPRFVTVGDLVDAVRGLGQAS